ncbi:MAG: S8 family serine peptidase [Actinomycetota bacterium]
MGTRATAVGVILLAIASAYLLPRATSSTQREHPAPMRAHPLPGSRDTTRTTPADHDFDRARTKAKKDGKVSVIVGLRTVFVPEGAMPASVRGHQRSEIAKEQQDVRNDLVGHDYREIAAYETVPYIALSLSEKAVERLRTSNNVATIQLDAKRRASLTQSSPLVEADDMWAAGTTGAGYTVAVLDTGVDKTHAFLSPRVVEEACYSGGGFSIGSVCPGGVSSSTASGSGVPCPQAGCEHGTHVAGIAAGAGTTRSGVANGANIMSVQVFSSDGFAYTSDIIKGLERVYAVRTTRQIASVNMSLGGGKFKNACNGEAERPVIDNLLSAGIPTAIATGNDGWTDAISSPACISSAVAVGSTEKDDDISTFTNNHPTLTDLLAPGTSITSSIPGGNFAAFNGTSMATPHVAGAFALLRQGHPPETVATLLAALQTTGVAIPDAGYTRPRILIAQASAAITGGGGGGGGGGPTTHNVTFSVGGAGKGGVTGDGVLCARPKRFGTDCFEAYVGGSEVTFWAVPQRGSRFHRWRGDFSPCGGFRGCTIVAIDTDYAATARFKRK